VLDAGFCEEAGEGECCFHDAVGLERSVALLDQTADVALLEANFLGDSVRYWRGLWIGEDDIYPVLLWSFHFTRR